ncbi:MAG: reverse transcriptase family protein [Sedimenticola sp.]
MGGHTFTERPNTFDNGQNQSTSVLNILSLNVCGLRTRQVYPEFKSLLAQFDIISMQETKLDDLDISTVMLNDYNILFKNRKTISKYKSGGLAVAIKSKYYKYIREIKTDSKLVLWFAISKQLTCLNDDVLCGAIYIPPERTKYSVIDPYIELQNELNSLSPKYSEILLIGDTNSRTGKLREIVEPDAFLCNEHNLEFIVDEYNEILSHFQNTNVSLERINADSGTNTYGYELIEFCKFNNLFILNGRTGHDDHIGMKTCRDASTVDYFIASPNLFACIDDFHVMEFCSMFSDVHNPVCASINISGINETNQNVNTEEIFYLWNEKKTAEYLNNFDNERLNVINNLVNQLPGNVTQSNIDNVVNNIGLLFTTCAKDTFGVKPNKPQTSGSNKNNWYGNNCRKTRKDFHRAKYQYKLRKTDDNKQRLSEKCKQYKTTLNKYYKQYKQEKVNKLRKLRKGNTKEYWKIINGNKNKPDVDCPLEKLYEHFKSIGQSDNSECLHNQTEHNDRGTNEEINTPITSEEILKVIKSLKNNKANGIDSVVNEHLKHTAHIMLPTYVKLFNIILDTGVIPESWTIGIIKPIYKKNGDFNDPGNYRPITLLSCFGKLFTAIINKRLTKFAEEHHVIRDSQAGFRKGHSTADNLFVLHALTQILQKNKKKLYCAFIDFKAAFDKVWRNGLWTKLIDHNINGKCLTLIKNMYNNIKSCVLANGNKSSFFSCNIGVRQGENLSPLLFSLYLNDLELFLMSKDVSGIKCQTHELDDEIGIYLKLFILLYADDTVLFSDTAIDLQNSLTEFHKYCVEWKLTVNINKSKILIFSKGRPAKRSNFFLNDTKLEIVTEYKYLGIFMSQSGSFTNAKKHIANQATKAMYSLLSKVRELNLPVDIQIDLFEKTIKPILLYGSEIWGYGNNEVIERVQLKYYKYALNLKRSTPSTMIYGELGIFPVQVDILTRMTSFWTKLITPDNIKLSGHMYSILFSLYTHGNIDFQWISYLKQIFIDCGLSGLWTAQNVPNIKWLICSIKQKLKDLYISKWRSVIQEDKTYRLFKENICTENYLLKLTEKEYKPILLFRTRNHKLPVETGRWTRTDRQRRICKLCNNDLGDEYHHLLCCKELKRARASFLKPYYYTRPNTIKFHQLMNTSNLKELHNLSKFVSLIMKYYWS